MYAVAMIELWIPLVETGNVGKKYSVYDSTDYKIIKILKKDARTAYSEIARSLHIDVRNVTKRIEKLISTKAIRLTAIIDPGNFGYESITDINLYVEPARFATVVEELAHIPNISYMAKGWGKPNLLLQARFKNNKEMLSFIEEFLPNIEGVTVDTYMLVPHIIHDIDCWMPNGEDFK